MAGKSPMNTPLMKQYNAIKAKYTGALLLFRVGDFYETFGEDAIEASKALDIVLTKRGLGSASEIELAGFPHHALDTYLPKLVRAGHRVAICDQLEDPRFMKGIVKRGVTELVTPGVSYNDSILEGKKNNFLASLYITKEVCGLALLDISTGEFYCAQGSENYILKLIHSLSPEEIIYCKSQRVEIESQYQTDYALFMLDDWVYNFDFAKEKLLTQFKTTTLKGFGIDNLHEGIIVAGAILHYLEITEHTSIDHITAISRLDEGTFVWIDKFTVRNLELVSAQNEEGVPLIKILDQTTTPMGSRLLKSWIVLPLKSIEAINDRLRVVSYFFNEKEIAESIIELLRQIADLERLISKVAVFRINPRELVQLKRSLKTIEPIKKLLSKTLVPELKKLIEQLNSCDSLLDKIEKELNDEAPMLINKGGIIKDGVNPELDELRSLSQSGKTYLKELQEKEVERTKINSLKISFNKIFGYYFEVSNAHKDKVPVEWIRKQTLVNAERYVTEELKIYEEKILNAEEKLVTIEQQLFQQLVLQASYYISPIQQNARIIATLDCLLSFSCVARSNKYVAPQMDESMILDIKNGRHPVIEQQLPMEESYVPNDVFLDDNSQQILIITGPNMAGKSAMLRQTALIVIMAQIGSFVPAESARIGIVDKVFTRVGATDNLSRGESTFMVEMTETASILNNLSSRSLIIMDEIGRGTSTYDGVSIAWAIVEYLHQHSDARPKTLFATHYHELNQLAEDFVRVKNFNVSVKEVGDKIIFMRKLKPGGSEHSFGIHVAQIAGMPMKIVFRANEILRFLEKEKQNKGTQQKLVELPKGSHQMSLFDSDPKLSALKQLLEKIDINGISPVEALLKLNEIIQFIKL